MPLSPPVCSIVIPTFNNSFYTKLCLTSLVNSRSVEPSYEIVVVDNASVDDTLVVLNSFRDHIAEVVRNDVNRGFATACNQGANKTSGHFVLFLNNDIVVEPGWLSHMVCAAQSDPAIGAVGARLLHPDGTIQHAGITLGPQFSPIHSFYGYPGDWPEALLPRDYQAVTGACLLVERQLFDRLGGFDSTFLNSFEDVDLCFKIRHAGRRVHYCPAAVCHHFESPTADRFLRDDRNLHILRRRWAGSAWASIDFNPDDQPLQKVVSQTVLLRDELAQTARRANLLSATNVHLQSLLAQRSKKTVAGQRLTYEPGHLGDPVAGSMLVVPVLVTNAGDTTWPARRLRLSYHWQLNRAADYVVWEGLRTVFEEALGPGQSIVVMAQVLVPDRPGEYILEWDTVEEGVAWMSARGVPTIAQSVAVSKTSSATAMIEGLPLRMRCGEAVSCFVEIEAGDEASDEDIACCWTTLDGRLLSAGPSLVATVKTAAAKLPVTLAAPFLQGLVRLQVFHGREAAWLTMETFGGLARVIGDETLNQAHAAVQQVLPASELGRAPNYAKTFFPRRHKKPGKLSRLLSLLAVLRQPARVARWLRH